MNVAFFDIGTNSIHMKLVKVHKDASFEVLEHEKDMTRVGDGSFKSKKLSKRSMKRSLKTLKRFAGIAGKNDSRRTYATATSAVREAKNGRQFVKDVFKKTGIRVRVISGQQEARLIFLGACSGDQKNPGRTLAIDVGGGSAELVLGNRRGIDCAESLPLGVARLTDRFLSRNQPSKDDLRCLEHHIEDMLAAVLNKIGQKKFSRVIGTGGTMINLGSMIYEGREKRRLRLRGTFELKRKELAKLHRKITRLKFKRLQKMPGLDKKRADIITAGSLLVLTLMRLLRTDKIFVSDKGIREGMILDYLMRKKLKRTHVPPSVRVQWFGQKPLFAGRIY